MIKRSFRFKNQEGKGLKGYAFRYLETINYNGQLERFASNLTVDFNSQGTFFLRDHNPERVLARYPDTLRFNTDNEGLSFEADFIDTPLWRETRELVSKGVLNGASVGFSVVKERQDKDILVYERIKLYEISLVTWPAYSSSVVSARDLVQNKHYPPEIYL